jgi:hypothetical protein
MHVQPFFFLFLFIQIFCQRQCTYRTSAHKQVNQNDLEAQRGGQRLVRHRPIFVEQPGRRGERHPGRIRRHRNRADQRMGAPRGADQQKRDIVAESGAEKKDSVNIRAFREKGNHHDQRRPRAEKFEFRVQLEQHAGKPFPARCLGHARMQPFKQRHPVEQPEPGGGSQDARQQQKNHGIPRQQPEQRHREQAEDQRRRHFNKPVGDYPRGHARRPVFAQHQRRQFADPAGRKITGELREEKKTRRLAPRAEGIAPFQRADPEARHQQRHHPDQWQGVRGKQRIQEIAPAEMPDQRREEKRAHKKKPARPGSPFPGRCRYGGLRFILHGRYYRPAAPLMQAAPAVTLGFPRKEQTGPRRKTTVKLLRDETTLYAAFCCEDRDIAARHRDRDDYVFQEDCAELFLCPAETSKGLYFGLEMNCLGTLYDYIYVRLKKLGEPLIPAFNLTGVRIATRIQGTLNDSSDTDEGWTLEFAVPFSNFLYLETPPPERRTEVAN